MLYHATRTLSSRAFHTTTTLTLAMPIDTKTVHDRRPLRFHSLAEVRSDLAILEAGFVAGTLRSSGNWTPGQNLAHVANWIAYAYDGYPTSLGKPPFLIKFIMKLMKNKYLYGKLPVGVKIPKVPGGTVGADDLPFDRSLAMLRSQLDRLELKPPSTPNPIFGELSHKEWQTLHARHAELHLSFLHPK